MRLRIGMLDRLDLAEAARLYRRDLPRPLDVVNLIHLRDERSYAQYGLAVAPVLMAVGGRVRWMGEHERAVWGTPHAERFIVVRYPSQRRFLAMTLNPYYLAINRLREGGVSSFEASFTHPRAEPLQLGSQRSLLVAHFDDPDLLPRLRERLEPAGAPLVYATREVSSIGLLRDPRPTDPNPLSFKEVACFAAPDRLELVPLEGVSLQLYRREHPRRALAAAR